MTDITKLVSRLYKRLQWQKTPTDLYDEDLSEFIAEGIQFLYVNTTRQHKFSEDMFEKDGDLYVSFSETLHPEEVLYVLKYAELQFYRMVSTHYDEMVSYSTDALTVTHGDKPFQNINTLVEKCEAQLKELWNRQDRNYRHLGVHFA